MPDAGAGSATGALGRSAGTDTTLSLMAAAAAAGVVAGDLAPPSPGLLPAILLVAGAAALAGVRRHPRARMWWLAAAVLVGLGASAAALRCPASGDREAVRFEAVVRDGWREATRGFANRLRITAIERAGRWRPANLELRATVGGERAMRDLPAPGSRIEGSGELRFDSRWPLKRPTLTIKSAALLEVLPGVHRIDRLRDGLVHQLDRAAGVDPARIRAASLAAALVLGRREGLPRGEVELLRTSGVAHLLAVSGLHVGIVAALAWLLLAAIPVPPAGKRLAVAAVVLGFMVLAGGAAPVRRAAIGLALYLASRTLGRRLDPLSAVAAIVAGMMIADPGAALETGFQLSALVTLALVRWVEPISRRFRPRLGRAAPALAVVLIAQGASIPIVATVFGRVSPLGAIANLALVPLAFPAVAAAMAAVAVAPLSLAGGAIVLSGLAAVKSVLDVGAGALASPPLLVPVPSPVLVAIGLVLAVAALSRTRVAGIGATAWVVLTAGYVALPHVAERRSAGIEMLPVGEGAAVAVLSGDGAVLFDGGLARMDAARALADHRLDRLDAVVLTHADADHIGGVGEILRDLRVKELVIPALIRDRSAIVPLRRLARLRGVRVRTIARLTRLTRGGVRMNVVWPPSGFSGSDNDGSLVTQVAVKGHTALLTGDIEARGERRALAAGPGPWRADVLVVPHHGSATSTTAGLISEVKPVVALIPTGTRPRFAYPARSVRRRLRAADILTLPQDEGFPGIRFTRDGWVTVEGPQSVEVPIGRSEP